MKIKLFLALLGISILSGCRATGRLYPFRGPLSAQTPAPVLLAKFTGAFGSGNISVVLADGEVCKGRWANVPRVQASKGPAVPSTVPPSDMPVVWDTVYGSGFYVAHVLGERLYVQSVVTGDRGTVLDVEMYRPEGKKDEGHARGVIKGVAKDSQDNIYKLVF
jgi:hypothetical protein